MPFAASSPRSSRTRSIASTAGGPEASSPPMPKRRFAAPPPATFTGLAGKSVKVAGGGAANRLFGIGGDDASGPPAVEAIERVRLDRGDDAANGIRCERYEIRVAIHEAHPAPVGHDLDRIAGEQRARTTGAGRPMQDAAAGEMPAAADERQTT